MRASGRRLFPYVVAVLGAAALTYAVSFGRLPPADFRFVNGTELQSIDPAQVTGAPEGRIINALFEGLLRQDPKSLKPIAAIADLPELSDDLKTYTFQLRKDCRWTDGTPITAHDFHWSWQRFLHPETASKYAYQLYDYVDRADQYNRGEVAVGDAVEVELANRKFPGRLYPRGTIVRGRLTQIIKPAVDSAPRATEEAERSAENEDRKQWIYVVQVGEEERRFSKDEALAVGGVERCRRVLLDFAEVGIRVLDDYRLQVQLKNPTPYFLYLMAFYPMYPVNRACVEKYGRAWTRAENIVTSGPYRLEFRRIRDRIRLVKNPDYWNADAVQLEVIDALAVTSETTSLNMYINGQVDWIPVVPTAVVPILKERADFRTAPMLTTYFYRFNTKRKPLDNVLVRRALNMAVNKKDICDKLLQGGQQPARSLVPSGLPGYTQALAGEYNVERAQALLAEAGYPGGRGIPVVEILYNDNEAHEKVALRAQSDWKKNLGIDVSLKKLEWGVYLDAVSEMQYTIARAGWIGDYPDPNTFLDMFVTDGPNNETGWSNPRYDELIRQAASEGSPAERMKMLHEAAQILMDEQPLIPIYFYVSINMVRPYVEGFYTNIQDLHPLHALRIDEKKKADLLRSSKLP